MFDALRKLVGGRNPMERAWSELPRWAASQGWQWRGVSPEEGFVIEPMADAAPPWRIEWGASQRDYIEGFELRLRAELALPAALQVALFDRALHARLERAVFEEFVGDLHTRIDARTPPEMRWLVMLAKVPSQHLGALRKVAVAVGSDADWVRRWLDGALSEGLVKALARPSNQSGEGEPVSGVAEASTTEISLLAMTIARGRLTWRAPLALPDVASVERMKSLFDLAVQRAGQA